MNARHLITAAVAGGGTLSVYTMIPGKWWFRARMKWPTEKSINGKISLSLDGALDNLEAVLRLQNPPFAPFAGTNPQ